VIRVCALVALAGLCGACSLAPHYQRPGTATPPAVYAELDGWKIAVPADGEPKGRWWMIYRDAALDALEAQVADANQSLKAAFARLQEAHAQTGIARAAYLPSLTADANATRTKASVNSPNFFPGERNPVNDFSVGAALSYEIDLFGRVRVVRVFDW
jgi:outer membrane protein, multidrug efflux system